MFGLPVFKSSCGQIIGISSERARMHAIRLRKHISRVTPRAGLYELVDVVIPAAVSERAFQFSDFTLADQTMFQHWSQTDREAFSTWLQEGSQRYEIEGARRKLLYDTLPQRVITHATLSISIVV